MRSKTFTDKSETENGCKGSVRDGVMTVWHRYIQKKEFNFKITVSEIDKVLGIYGNSNYAIYEIVQIRIHEADERWIENTKDPHLREVRRNIMENDSLFGRFSALDSRRTDSACRVVKALYKLETGNAPKSWIERLK